LNLKDQDSAAWHAQRLRGKSLSAYSWMGSGILLASDPDLEHFQSVPTLTTVILAKFSCQEG